MKNLKKDWLMITIILLPLVLVAIFWNNFPDKIPTHFDWKGKPDDYGDKFKGLLLLPVINLALYILLLYLPKIDPKGENYALFSQKYNIIRFTLHTFLSGILIIIIFYALGYTSDVPLMIQFVITLLFLIMGNYMSAIRQNYFFGFRTPWTLANEKVWTKTHRLGAKIWVAGSVVMFILLPLLKPDIRSTSFLAYVAILVVIPTIYSYVVFKKLKSQSA